MKKKITLHVDPSRTKIRPWDSTLKEVLSEVLSYETPKKGRVFARQMAKAKGFAPPPDRQSLVHGTGSFKTGLLSQAVEVLNTDPRLANYEYEIDNLVPHPPLDVDAAAKRLEAIPFVPRDYQYDAIFTAIEQGRGVIAIPTGGGKSVVLAGVAAALNLKTLIVVDSEDLAKQLKREIEEATGVSTGRLWTGTPAKETECQFVVCLRQTLVNRIAGDNAPMSKWAKTIGCIIVDECHHATSDGYDKIFSSLPNATYRFGFTATPEGSSYDGDEDLASNTILIKANIGPVIYELKMKHLIEQGWLSRPVIKLIQNEIIVTDFTTDYGLETELHLVNGEARNRMGCQIALEAYHKGENVIIFVKRVAHGLIVRDMLIDMGVHKDQVAYINGTTEGSKRSEAIENFKQGTTKILIGTVLTEGLNFVVSTGVNLGGGRSGRYIVQALGRVLRKPKSEGQDVVKSDVRHVAFYDMLDSGHVGRAPKGVVHHPMFRKHGRLRRERYEQEGHQIIMLQPSVASNGDYSI
jgi:superfamily II DNA or RNA helicase